MTDNLRFVAAVSRASAETPPRTKDTLEFALHSRVLRSRIPLRWRGRL